MDSGGQGLYRLFQGALLHLVGRAPASGARDSTRAAGPKASALIAHADEGFGYETMFLLQPNGSGSLDVDGIRDHLESIGESVLVAGDARALKVHVHNERPDLVVGYGLSLGTISRISIENLDNQARDVRETRAAAFTADVDGAPEPRAADATTPATEAPTLGVVSVVAGDGLAAIFEDFGVAASFVAVRPRTRARASSSRPSPGWRRDRSSSCPTTRTSSWPPGRSPPWPIARSWSSRPETRQRDSPRCSRSTRSSTRPRTNGR